MRHGSVVIDLAAEAGGNCEGTQPGEIVHTGNGVTIDGSLNLPSRMAEHASRLYSRNIESLLELMSGEEGALALDFDDEVIRGACVARDGKVA
jgi:NAD(P) transhydrogenase subunit alpha